MKTSMKSILPLLILCIFFVISYSFKSFGNEISIEGIKQILNTENKITLEEERLYADMLRRLSDKYSKSSDSNAANAFLEIYSLAEKLRLKIRHEFPKISDEKYEKSFHSMGIALNSTISDKEVITILLREARLLSMPASMMLIIKYKFGGQNPEILQFIKEEADAGVPRFQFEYGKIILEGMGVSKNEEEGVKLIKLSKVPEADLELMYYYYKKEGKESPQFEHYLRLAASHDMPEGLYNLAIFEQDRKNYEKAFELLKKTLEIEPSYEVALLELARMYAEGWGVEKDIPKSLEMFEQLAKQTKNVKLKDLALENIRRLK